MTEIKSWKDRIDYTEPPMIMRMSKAKDEEIADLRAELAKSQPVRPMSDDLAALVSRLARALGKANPSHDLPVKAMRYLADNDLLNGPWLRSKEYGATDEDIATFVAHIKGATE